MKDGVGGNYQMRGLPGPKANLLPSEPPAVSTQRPLGAKEQLNSNGGWGVSCMGMLGKWRRFTRISSECANTINCDDRLGCPQPQTLARYSAACH